MCVTHILDIGKSAKIQLVVYKFPQDTTMNIHVSLDQPWHKCIRQLPTVCVIQFNESLQISMPDVCCVVPTFAAYFEYFISYFSFVISYNLFNIESFILMFAMHNLIFSCLS